MTLLADLHAAAPAARAPATRRVAAKPAAVLTASVAAVAGVAALALLLRPYGGLQGDARIYVGRAVADLDPAGVGRDLMWAGDGQSGYSLFPRALAALTAVAGPARAAALAAAAALALWTAAAALALGAWAGAGRRAGLLAAVLAAPAAYGGFALAYGEAGALPRPFAEALVLLGLWALANDRPRASAGLMLAAAAVHPIMALPGAGVLLAVLGARDRRWWWLAAAGAAGLAAAALLGLPLARRLLQPVDADWLAVLRLRAPALFPGRWSADAWARVATTAVTAALGARLLEGSLRVLLAATLATAAALLAASCLLGEDGRSLLVLQLQPWRGLWLLSFVAAAALPLVWLRLWRDPAPAGRLAAVALAVAWAGSAAPAAAFAALVAAAALAEAARRGRTPPRPVLTLGWALALAFAALLVGAQGAAMGTALSTPPGAPRADVHALLQLDPWRVLAMAGGVWALAEGRRRGWPWGGSTGALAGAAIVAALLAAAGWDDRAPDRRTLDDPAAARGIAALVASRPGAVLWLGGDLQPALLAGRPAWWSEMQGASNVFSRAQALEWARRGRRLVETGAGPRDLLAPPFPHTAPPTLWLPTADAAARFCAAPDAPAWMVAPVDDAGLGAARRRGAAVWTAPDAARYLEVRGGAVAVRSYALLPCAGGARA